jgi:hypothetical protein
MGPETPLTSTREIMADTVPLYQLAVPSTKLVADSNDSKGLKTQAKHPWRE